MSILPRTFLIAAAIVLAVAAFSTVVPAVETNCTD